MKTKFSYLLVLFLALVFAQAIEARGQDETPGPESTKVSSQEPNAEDDKALLFEQEGRSSRAVLRDTLAARPGTVGASTKSSALDGKKPKEETDPLNFNFLYYIIQKFKTADLLEE